MFLPIAIGLFAAALLVVLAASALAYTPPPVQGDWVVSDDTLVNGGRITLDGNISVTSTGNLTLQNIDLILNTSFPGEFGILVRSGGRLALLDTDHDPGTEADATVIGKGVDTFSYTFRCEKGSQLVISASIVRSCGVDEPGREGLVIETDDAHIDNSTIQSCWWGVHVNGSAPLIEDTLFEFSSVHGILVRDGSPRIVRCVFRDNGYSGIYVDGSSGTRILNCTFNEGIAFAGAYLENLSDCHVNGTAFLGCGVGMYVRDSSPLISMCNFTYCFIYGLQVQGGWTTVEDSTFKKNTDCGARINGSTGTSFYRCTFEGNEWAGIYANSSGVDVKHSRLYNNTMYGAIFLKGCSGDFDGCELNGSQWVGLYLGEDCSLRVMGCDIANATHRGIWVTGADPILLNSWIYSCGNDSVYLHRSSFEARGLFVWGSGRSGLMVSDCVGFSVDVCSFWDHVVTAVYIGSVEGGSSEGTLRNCSIFDNERTGIYIADGSRLHVENGWFWGNGAYGTYCSGEGVAEWVVTENGTATNETFRLRGNITVRSYGELTLTSVLVAFNSTTDHEFGLVVETGRLWLLDRDGDANTSGDATEVMSIEHAGSSRALVGIAVGDGGAVHARNCYLPGIELRGTGGRVEVIGCEFMEADVSIALKGGSALGGCLVKDSLFVDAQTGVNATLNDLRIINCTFSRCGMAVGLFDCDGAWVIDASIVSCGIGVRIDGGADVRVDGLRSLDCGDALFAVGTDDLLVNGSYIRRSSAHGIRLTRVTAEVVGTDVGSSGAGALVVDDCGLVVTSSNLYENVRVGVMANRSSLHLVSTAITKTEGIAVWSRGGDLRLDDSFISMSEAYHIRVESGIPAEAFNTTVPPDRVKALDTATLDVWWRMRVRVEVEGGLTPPLPVSLRIEGATGVVLFGGSVGATAATPWKWARQYRATSEGVVWHSPYNASATVSGKVFTSQISVEAETDFLMVVPLELRPTIASPPVVEEGSFATFDGSASTSFPFGIDEWEWDFEWDGTFAKDLLGPTADWTFKAHGRYSVALRVVDDLGNANLTVVEVDVRDLAPLAFITGDPPEEVDEDEVVNLTGRYESPADSVVLEEWDFGDGTTAEGAVVEHAWQSVGTYTVTYTVYDFDGSNGIASFEVAVQNVPPVASLPAGVLLVAKGQRFLLDYSLSHDTPSDTLTLTFNWEIDGVQTAVGKHVHHTFPRGGTYTVTLTVIDDDGASATDSMTVVVTNQPPELGALPDLYLHDDGPSETIILEGKVSDPDDDLANLSITVSVDNGKLLMAEVIFDTDHGYQVRIDPRKGRAGRATVTVSVEDAEGEEASTTFNVTVEKSPSKVFEVPWKAVLIIVIVALAFVAGWALRRRRSDGRGEPPDEEEDSD